MFTSTRTNSTLSKFPISNLMSCENSGPSPSAAFDSPPARAFQGLSGQSPMTRLILFESPRLNSSGCSTQLFAPEGTLLKQEESPSLRRELISSITLNSWAPSYQHLDQCAGIINPNPSQYCQGAFTSGDCHQQLQNPSHWEITRRSSGLPWCTTAALQSFAGREGGIKTGRCKAARWTSTDGCEVQWL